MSTPPDTELHQDLPAGGPGGPGGPVDPGDPPVQGDPDGEADGVPPREPVTPIGPPEPVDLRSHPWATLVGVVAVLAVFLFASMGLGRALDDSEERVEVPRVSVPQLDGRGAEDAQRTLERLGLLVALEYQPNELVPAGVVFDQRPVAGAKLEIGTEVTLVLSDGPAGITVPDVRGFQGGEAAGLLQALGLTPQLQPVYDEVIRPGEVVSTSPAAGNRATPGAPVVVAVSNGPAPRIVPGHRGPARGPGPGRTGAQRRGPGDGDGLLRGGQGTGHRALDGPGARHRGAPGEPRDVVVSGTTGHAHGAVGDGSAAGLCVVHRLPRPAVTQHPQPTVPAGDARAGRVVSQSLPGGTPVAAGTPVQLVVGVAAAPPTTTTTTVATVPTTTHRPGPPAEQGGRQAAARRVARSGAGSWPPGRGRRRSGPTRGGTARPRPSSSRWRRPMMSPSSVSAVISSTSGSVEPLDDERVVAGGLERVGQTGEHAGAVVVDQRGLAVHHLRGPAPPRRRTPRRCTAWPRHTPNTGTREPQVSDEVVGQPGVRRAGPARG